MLLENMSSCFFLLVTVLAILYLKVFETGYGREHQTEWNQNEDKDQCEKLQQEKENIYKAVLDIAGTPESAMYSPKDTDSPIQYLLYTPDHPEEPCFLEPNLEALERCPFNATYPMKFLIHGFIVKITPDSVDNVFMLMKNKLLALYECNVIVVDWSNYNRPPYTIAAFNSQLVALELSNLIKYLEKNKGIDPENIHLIGQSLGAQMAGATGRITPNLGRITGLDPTGPLFFPITLFPHLNYKDANFVDVIHSSNATYGYGINGSFGDVDFYPNGGVKQPQCDPMKTPLMLQYRTCNHDVSTTYFLQSINTTECLFRSIHCDSYDDFLNGQCPPENATLNLMGLPAKKIPGLPPRSKFYLRTGDQFPNCLRNDYESEWLKRKWMTCGAFQPIPQNKIIIYSILILIALSKLKL